MSASDTFENDILLLLLNNTNIAGLGDATGVRGSTTAGSLYVALHTADPGEAGSAQTTNEATYPSYARVAVARTAAGWTVTGSNYANTAGVTWPKCTGATTDTATHFSIGTSATGAGLIVFSGPLDSSLAISSGIAPFADVGELHGTAD